jgi:uncharacterized membrane protein HdeD (DUF308 family)
MDTPAAKSLSAVPWWLVLLQAILSIVVGILVLSAPRAAMIFLVRLLGLYWMIKGIFSLTAIFHPEAKHHRGWLIFNSALGLLAGFAVLDHPLISAVFVPAVLVTFVGIAGVFIGVNDLLAAFRGGGLAVGLLGVVSLLLGGMVLANTLIGVAIFPYVVGITELAGGGVIFFLAFKMLGAKRLRAMAQQSQ